jgi:hypothetical protein
MIFIGVVVFGLFSLQRLAIDLMPEMEIPFITVMNGISISGIKSIANRCSENNPNTTTPMNIIMVEMGFLTDASYIFICS